MKRLLVGLAAFMLVGSMAYSQGQCPAAPDDPIGQIRCGETNCGELVDNMTFSKGQCRASWLGVCCKKTPLTTIAEGLTVQPDIDIWLEHPNRSMFNYLNGPVHMVAADGVVLRGHYRSGTFYWSNGTTSKRATTCDPEPEAVCDGSGVCCTWNPATYCYDCSDGSTVCLPKPKPKPKDE